MFWFQCLQTSKCKHGHYNLFLVYCHELALGTVSLTGDRAQGNDSKHDSHYRSRQHYRTLKYFIITFIWRETLRFCDCIHNVLFLDLVKIIQSNNIFWLSGRGLMLWLLSGPLRFSVEFLLLRYSVLYTVESLSKHLLFISWFICSWRWCIDKLGVFNANQTSMCLDPYLN